MLCLSRKCGQRILVGDDIVITIVRISPTTVRMGIAAPGNMNIVRSELVKQERSSAEENSQGQNVDGSHSSRTADSVRGS